MPTTFLLWQNGGTVEKPNLIFRPFPGDVSLNVVVQERGPKAKQLMNFHRLKTLEIGAAHDASFMQQPGDGFQFGYLIMLAPTALYEQKSSIHLLDWNSAEILRKVRSTLAAEASGGSRAYDRAIYARAMIHEIGVGKKQHWTEICNYPSKEP